MVRIVKVHEGPDLQESVKVSQTEEGDLRRPSNGREPEHHTRRWRT